MKILLASLMCLVLVASECFAIHGPPPYPGGTVRTSGNYAGLFFPANGDDNSLGIFSIGIPNTGLGDGELGLFRNGIFYPGTLQGVADPDSAVLTAVVSSSFNITFSSTTDGTPPKKTDFVITFNANGAINARIVANTNAFSSASARLMGYASVTYATVGGAPNFDASTANSVCPDDTGGTMPCPIVYSVSGFKQSEATQ